MRAFLKIICAFGFAVAGVPSATAQQEPASPSAAERYIRESERQWAESVASGDASVVARILADDFIGVDPEGKQYTSYGPTPGCCGTANGRSSPRKT